MKLGEVHALATESRRFVVDADEDADTDASDAVDDVDDAPPRRSPPLWALVGVAALVGVVAAFATSGGREGRKARAARVEASKPDVWPRPLPREPAQWLRESAADCGLRVTGLRTEAHATTFPSPSGASVVLWEVSMRLGADGAIEDVRQLMDRLGAGPCGVHVPELTLSWDRGNKVRMQMHAVLLGTWPSKTAPPASRRGNRS
jgi:hypothetical protein